MSRAQEHIEMNRTAWDEAHRHMRGKRRANPRWVEEFQDGKVGFSPTERELLGDVSGMEILQLSCAGDASQAFWLANLGGRVTACDFSPIAIEEAKENGAQIGLDVQFVVADSRTLNDVDDNRFDLVHADYNLWYYEDLTLACGNWYRVLRKKGRLLVHEWNPVSRCLRDDDDSDKLYVIRSYDDHQPRYYQFAVEDFVSERQAVEFSYTMADIINALLEAGFVIERMVERTRAQFEKETGRVPPTGDRTEDSKKASLPHDFFLMARRDR